MLLWLLLLRATKAETNVIPVRPNPADEVDDDDTNQISANAANLLIAIFHKIL